MKDQQQENELLSALHWRYSTKRMTGAILPTESFNRILEAVRLAPSSIGLQPYNLIVIDDLAIRQQLQPIINNQPQVAEASHLIVFAAWDRLTEERIDAFERRMLAARPQRAESIKKYKDGLVKRMNTNTPEANFNWFARQVYLAIGIAIVAAALERIDATPIEGFQPAKLDDELRLPSRGLRSVALLALGYRDAANDQNLGLKKVRKSNEEFILTLPLSGTP